MSEYLTDKEQIEVIKQWWRRYGTFVLTTVVVILAVIFGWYHWRNYEYTHAAKASSLYTELEFASKNNNASQVNLLTEELVRSYRSTPYAALAQLYAAKSAVENKKYPVAVSRLKWVIAHSNMNGVKQVARLRAARILHSENNNKAALVLLDTVNDSTYSPLINSEKGDIYNALGEKKQAQQFYKLAQSQLQSTQLPNNFLSEKLAQEN